MRNIEIPLGKRTKAYRFFEMLPALLSYGSIVLLIALSIIDPLYAAFYLMLMIITTLVKAAGIAWHTVGGHRNLVSAQRVDWHGRLQDLESAHDGNEVQYHKSSAFMSEQHLAYVQQIQQQPGKFPRPSQLYHAVVVAAYNESLEVIEPTIQSIADTSSDNERLIVVFAYEERGGEPIESIALYLQSKYGKVFKEFLIVKHPIDLPGEVRGKGGNITFGGYQLKEWLNKHQIAFNDVIVTTLDCDNRPHRTYFDYLAYEYIVHPDRKQLAYQPVALFLNNIWDAPAPMRVIATGNSFWNIISSMRPHTLRNFASHSQPMDALVEMNFWSTRTIVEDGHQYWRSYFHFNGHYRVIPIFVPIYQDAVLSDTYARTLKAQFIQLRRWAYGASDVPYVATHLFNKSRNVAFWPGFARLVRLIDSHVTLASVAILAAVGGWAPLLFNSQSARSIAAHQLPEVMAGVQQVAAIGIFITVFFTFKMLPPRPARYRRRRNVWMLLQWLWMPITSVIYSSASAFVSQTALLLGRYFDKFDVTEKAVVTDKLKKN